jgi:hypothetical protein
LDREEEHGGAGMAMEEEVEWVEPMVDPEERGGEGSQRRVAARIAVEEDVVIPNIDNGPLPYSVMREVVARLAAENEIEPRRRYDYGLDMDTEDVDAHS